MVFRVRTEGSVPAEALVGVAVADRCPEAVSPPLHEVLPEQGGCLQAIDTLIEGVNVAHVLAARVDRADLSCRLEQLVQVGAELRRPAEAQGRRCYGWLTPRPVHFSCSSLGTFRDHLHLRHRDMPCHEGSSDRVRSTLHSRYRYVHNRGVRLRWCFLKTRGNSRDDGAIGR